MPDEEETCYACGRPITEENCRVSAPDPYDAEINGVEDGEDEDWCNECYQLCCEEI